MTMSSTLSQPRFPHFDSAHSGCTTCAVIWGFSLVNPVSSLATCLASSHRTSLEFIDLRERLPTNSYEARKHLNLRIQHTVFDLATLWDRTFGGSTIVLHVEGTTAPNTPVLPEFLRCTAYLPPSFLAQNPASHGPITHIAQTFIESVGVPTINQWVRHARAHGWSLTQTGPRPQPNRTPRTLVPAPDSRDSSHYKFLGRPVGALDSILATAATSNPSPPPLVVIPDYDEEELLARLDDAEAMASEHLARIQELEEQAEMLISQVAALETALTDERHSNTVLCGTLNAPTRYFLSNSRHSVALSACPQHSHSCSPRSVNAHSLPPCGPPPYSPSARLMSPFSAGSPSRFTHHEDLQAFITSHGLDNHGHSIRMLIRQVHPVRWADELALAGIAEDLVPLLLEIMSKE
ncbi:hypothetical protein B0H10DRAFT_2230194 [Mycena sp. CBHHK59/15]|nr:hypothetical protein B0H10DRAFT_2230194 [Mycena sp. CBHHK59/15]